MAIFVYIRYRFSNDIRTLRWQCSNLRKQLSWKDGKSTSTLSVDCSITLPFTPLHRHIHERFKAKLLLNGYRDFSLSWQFLLVNKRAEILVQSSKVFPGSPKKKTQLHNSRLDEDEKYCSLKILTLQSYMATGRYKL